MDIQDIICKGPSETSIKQYQDWCVETVSNGHQPHKLLAGYPGHLAKLRQAMLDPKFQSLYWAAVRLYAMEFAADVATGKIYDDCNDKDGNPIYWKYKVKDNIINNQKWLFGRVERRLNPVISQKVDVTDRPRLAINVPAKVDPSKEVKDGNV